MFSKSSNRTHVADHLKKHNPTTKDATRNDGLTKDFSLENDQGEVFFAGEYCEHTGKMFLYGKQNIAIRGRSYDVEDMIDAVLDANSMDKYPYGAGVRLEECSDRLHLGRALVQREQEERDREKSKGGGKSRRLPF